MGKSLGPRFLARIGLVILAAAVTAGCDTKTSGPDESIVLSVPFATGDLPYGLIPMGETVNHPKPQNPEGHPGIDFMWDHPARILASAAGTVDFIEPGYWPGTWDVGVLTGGYLIGYTEMESYNPDLHAGGEVAAGDFVGYPQHPTGSPAGYRMIHWEFGYHLGGRHPDRLCPMSYFDPASRAIMEQIWSGTAYEYKDDFPEICSGDYSGKNQ